MNRYLSRKFLLAFFFAVVGTVLCAVGKLSGEQFVYLVAVCMGIHHGANVADAYVNPPITTALAGPTGERP